MGQQYNSPGAGPVATGVRRLWEGSITLPISIYDVQNPSNVADPANGGHSAFIANLDERCDFGKANPRNSNSHNYGAFPKNIPIYNTYLYQN